MTTETQAAGHRELTGERTDMQPLFPWDYVNATVNSRDPVIEVFMMRTVCDVDFPELCFLQRLKPNFP